MKKKLKSYGLFRKKPLTTTSESFRVLSVNKTTKEILVHGPFTSLREAQQSADDLKTSEIEAYVQGEQNRVIYRA